MIDDYSVRGRVIAVISVLLSCLVIYGIISFMSSGNPGAEGDGRCLIGLCLLSLIGLSGWGLPMLIHAGIDKATRKDEDDK